MDVLLISAAIAVVTGALSAWSWRRGRRVTSVAAAAVAACAALVAIRDLPEPVVVGLLVAALGAVAVVTAWPLLTGAGRTGSRKEADR